MAEPVIIDAVRTPIGKHRGALSAVRPDDLAAHVIAALLERNPAAKGRVDEVCFGSTNQAGEDNRNVARMALLLAGMPYEVTGLTVNRLCGSGLEAINHSARSVLAGDGALFVAGGVESMTRAPYSMAKVDEGFSRTPPAIYDTTLGWRYPNPKLAERFPLEGMGETAENVAERYRVSREDQDRFALESHAKAVDAWEKGRFASEVVPVTVPGPKGQTTTFARDESPRPDTTLERLAKLKPVFRKGGSVTAGNSSPLNDGAAAVLVADQSTATKLGLKPLARIVAWGVAGVEPGLMGIGPIPAARIALERAGLRAAQIDLVELNEAFASQSLACVRELGFDPARVNVNGGAIALGHPIGCSGARVVATLVHEMSRRGARWGLASMCIGVGQGIATIFEKV
ncbi:MAG: thiolase family protein [Deltaproteobacteria bacterium]|nr:thiolase family protein [Deltaproteobacteria bacterium]